MIDGLSFYDVAEQSYTDSEAVLFVECIMSDNIDNELILKCLTALAIHLELDEELYETGEQMEDEMGEEMGGMFGMAMLEGPMMTSDFNEFIEDSMELVLFNKYYHKWIQLYFDKAIEQEKYEVLHRLNIHERWNVRLKKN